MKPQKNRKGVFITIIVLLIIFVPLSIVSFFFHSLKNNGSNTANANPNHNFYHEGKLYFYDSEENLLGTYSCKNGKENCGLAKSSLNDTGYSLDYYKIDDLIMKPIQNKYVFLEDDETKTTPKVILYDIQNERIMTTYNSVKNYGIGIEEDFYIVSNENNKFGILSFKNDSKIIVPFDYDFIGVANFLNEDEMKIMNDLFAVYKDNAWFLIDKNGATLTMPITNEIVTYNGKYIIVKKENGYQIVNYNNQNVLENDNYNQLFFTGKYLNCLDQNNHFTVIDLNTNQELMIPITIQNTDEITSKINQNGNLDIILNGKIINTITIS